ncbi:isochorismatase family protein [Ornithinibacillus halophilus]|nr:isochorismatase family protein [Ornithinibacillus halophilus]
MKALLVIDVQNGIVNFGNFNEELNKIETIIKDFKKENLPVIFMKHFDQVEGSPLNKDSDGFNLHPSLEGYAEYVIEKETPSSFYKTELNSLLEKLNVDHLFIVGFNTEFCCMFTTIAAYDRGYRVTLIEDATGTVNNEDTYEMKGLDIRDFVGTVLHWSEVIEVLDFEEYIDEYQIEKG